MSKIQKVRQEQDAEYETALRKMDEDNDFKQALKLSEEEELNRIIIETASFKIPVLVYDITKSDNIYHLKFKFTDGSNINLSFDHREPISSLIQLLKFHLKTRQNIKLLIPIRKEIIYTEKSTISETDIKNRMVINVEII